MGAVHQDATASTMMIALPCVSIIWWRPVKLATAIAPPTAGTPIHAPWTTPVEVLHHAIFSASTLPCCPV